MQLMTIFVNVGKSLSTNIISIVDPLSYVDMCYECITDPLVAVDDVMTVISQLNNSAAAAMMACQPPL